MVLPSLTPLNFARARKAVEVPPPFRLRLAVPPIRAVSIMFPGYIRAVGETASQEAGLRYEEKIQLALKKLFSHYQAAPRISFFDAKGFRVCAPDGLLFDDDLAVVFEIKLQHMPEAWWQLEHLYKPVLKAWCVRRIVCVEIVRSFDPSMPFPGEFSFISELTDVFTCSFDFGVFVWKL